MFSVGLRNPDLAGRSFQHLWSLGFGNVTPECFLNWKFSGNGGLILTILIANAPQAILSFLFLTYNGLFTCMLLADEWNEYAHKRSGLRVTKPQGAQRSSYRLELPYRYGIPLLFISGLLHWLVSQSIFLARVALYDVHGHEIMIGDSMSRLGTWVSTVVYSPLALLTVIICGTVVVAIGIMNGFRTYRPGMPIVGSCSAAISAACHRPADDVDAALKPVKWGAVSTRYEYDRTPPFLHDQYRADIV